MLDIGRNTLPGMAIQKVASERQRGNNVAPRADLNKSGWGIVVFHSPSDEKAIQNLNKQVVDPSNKFMPETDVIVKYLAETDINTLNYACVRFQTKG